MKRIVNILITLLLVMCVSMPIFASTNISYNDIDLEHLYTGITGNAPASAGASETIGKTKVEIKSNSSKLIISTVIDGKESELIQMDGTGQGTVTVYESNFEAAKSSNSTAAMKLFVDGLRTTVPEETAQNIMSVIQDIDGTMASIMIPLIFEDVKGDIYTAYTVTSPFLDFISIIVGVGAVVLIALLLLSTVLDLAYIGLPVAREWFAGGEKGGEKNPPGVSFDAIATVKETESNVGEGYKNAYIIYLKRRITTYLVLGVCILYLIGGGLSGIISFVLGLVSGFM